MDHICRCSQCGGRFKVDAKHAGRRVKCPKCGEVTVVSADSAGDEPPRPTSVAGDAPGTSTPSGKPAVSSRFLGSPADRSQDDAATAPDLSLEAHEFATPPAPVGGGGGGASPPPKVPLKAVPLAGGKSLGPKPAPQAARPKPVESEPAGPPPDEVANSDGGFRIDIASPPRSQGSSPVRPLSVRKSKLSPLTLVIFAGGAGLLLAVAGIAVVAWQYSKGGPTVAAAAPRLQLDWPEGERSGAALTLDGKRRPLPASGAAVFDVSPGQHTLVLQRRGYEMIEFGFTVKSGESFKYRPEWKELGLGANPVTRPDRGAGGTADGAGSDVDVAPSGGPVGFSGWLQNLETAQRQARQQRKDIFVVFAGSDWSQASIAMAEKIFAHPEFRRFVETRFVRVVIDFPRTEAGFNQVENTAQNRELIEKYLVAQFPTIVLMDASARPYAIDGATDESVEKYVQRLNRLASQHGVRNDYFQNAAQSTLADDARLAKAQEAVVWLRDHRLLRFYPSELNGWLRLAANLDAMNEQGKLEVFFEADWLVRLANTVLERRAAPVKQQLGELVAWSRKYKFQDPDRAVRLHLAAFQLAVNLRDDEEAAKHVELAAAYAPRDAKLAKELTDARRAVASVNQLSSGTAFVVDASGYLLTNYHVVEGPGKNVVRLPGKTDTVDVEVVERDEERDMALLKIDPAPFGTLKPLSLAAAPVKRAASVAVFGFPLGDDIAREIRITTGVVSALPDQSEERMLLLDCRVNPGNSGGPVLQRDGRVIGMITAKTNSGGGVDSYGMALPTADLVEFLARRLPGVQPNGDPVGPSIEWESIDERVTEGNSVLMVLKLKP